MRQVKSIAFCLCLFFGAEAVAWAGLDVPPGAVDTSTLVTKSDMSVLQGQIPQPASSAPPAEVPGGAAGSTSTYRRGDAIQPRITRTKTLTLAADGTGTFDWTSQGALTTPVQVVVTPVYSGSGVPKCWATAASGTSTSVKCMVENTANITLAIVTSGLTLNSSASGMVVSVVVLPTS